jgi:branched-chain amino acid aminotransferase
MITSEATVEAEKTLNLQSSPKPAAFGSVFTANMLSATYENGAWNDFTIRPLQNFSLHPATLVLHYSQTIFEGMKAYRQADGSVALFRPQQNAARLNRSAERMAIPQIDEAAFVAALAEYVALEAGEVPARPGSLYLRPTIFASEAAIGVRAATKYEFFVIAMPVESYFSNPSATSLRVFVSESVVRAAPGGTGAVKAGANYGVTLKVIHDAKLLGCDQVLFLDSAGHRLVEEAGGMNFCIVRGNELITPPLSGTILAGITRDSLLKLAPSLALVPSERPIQIDELATEIESGVVSEVFLCGTAAVIASIGSLQFESGKLLTIGSDQATPVADKLRDALLDIQFGSMAGPSGWVVSAR